MKVVALEKNDVSLPDLAEMAKDGPVILTRNGQPLAAVKDLSGSDWESVALANNPRFLALIEESRRSHREEGGVSLDDLRAELGLKAKPRPRRRKKS
jgi:hypothetical protein